MDHFCVPCDVRTQARRLNLDVRRVQQLAKEGKFLKDAETHLYDCPHNVIVYTKMLQVPKRTKASGLTKKQEESLDIRNARDRAEVLREWGTVVLQAAVISELAPMIVSLKNGLREIPSIQARQVVLMVKECVDQALNGTALPGDHDLFTRTQKMLSEPQDEKLASFEKDLRAWMEGKGEGEADMKGKGEGEADVKATGETDVKATGGVSYKFTSPARRNVPDRLDLFGVLPMADALMDYVNERVEFRQEIDCRSARFEARRWSESDHPTSSGA